MKIEIKKEIKAEREMNGQILRNTKIKRNQKEEETLVKKHSYIQTRSPSFLIYKLYC